MRLLSALLVIQEHAEGGEGFASPFEVNFGLFFWTWVVFIILFYVLKRFAWPPIVRATEERERRIALQLDEAERLNREATAALEEHRSLLAGARQEAHDLMAEAKSAADGERQQILAKARADQEQMIERAKREIDAEKDRAISQLRREAVDLSLAAASKLIGERLDDDANRKLVQQYLGSLTEKH